MKEFHVCGLGNAIVDIFLELDDAEFAALGFERGTMRLVEASEQQGLLTKFHEREPRLVSAPAGSTRRRASRASAEALPPEAEARFDALRRLRLEIARAEAVPAFVVASDRTLRDLALLQPRTLAELQNAYGIGAAKAERYGQRFLAVLRLA